MTTLFTRFAPAAMTIALSLSTPLAAFALHRAAPVRTTVAVAATGLDLSRTDDRIAFDRRIWTAIVDACGTASLVDLEGQNDVITCRAAAKAGAASQRDQLVARATLANQPVLASK